MKRSAVIALAFILIIACIGCSSGKSKSTTVSDNIQVSDIFSVEVQTGDPYALFSKKDTRTRESYADGLSALYESCFNMPEVLASTMSAFPTAAHECGVESANPAAIDNSLDGDMQTALLDKLSELIENPKTEFRYAKWSGKANMLFMMPRDGTDETNPDTMMLFWDAVTVSDHSLLAIAVTYENGDTEYGYFDLNGGFQRFVPISDDKPAHFYIPS